MEERINDQTSDQALMLAVRDGDMRKLGVLFERYHKQLFNFLYRLTGNRVLSEDLVQEVFVRILTYRHTYRGENQFTTWMFQIARNARIDHWRQHPPKDTSIEEVEREFVSPYPTPGDYAEQSEEMQIMLAALARIPEDRREVLLLRSQQGMKFEEIAEILQCPVNTIKGRAFTGIRQLKAAVCRLRCGKSL